MDEVNPGADPSCLLLMASRKLRAKFLGTFSQQLGLSGMRLCGSASFRLLCLQYIFLVVLSCFCFRSPFYFMCRIVCLWNLFLEHSFKKSNWMLSFLFVKLWGPAGEGTSLCPGLASSSIKRGNGHYLNEMCNVGVSTAAWKKVARFGMVSPATMRGVGMEKCWNLKLFALIGVPGPILLESCSESIC